MFTKWNLARNPFSLEPISAGTLDWFVGRKKDLEICSKTILSRSVILIEGGLGVGTTSFANKLRFDSPLRTPGMELAVSHHWTSQSLLENVLVALLKTVLDEGIKTKVVKELRPLVDRIEKAGHGGGLSIMGFGAQYSGSLSLSPPLLIPFETLRHSLIKLAKALPVKGAEASFAVQINNLDPDETFDAKQLRVFLNDIRDSLQLPGISWLLVGKTGLAGFIRENVPRLRSIINHQVDIKPLSLKEMLLAIKHRMESCAVPGKKAKQPIEQQLLCDLYQATGGSLREVFQICGKLCHATASSPLYTQIDDKLGSMVIAEVLKERLKEVEKNKLSFIVLRRILKKPDMAQKELVKEVKAGQTSISRTAKSLIQQGFLIATRYGREVRYRVSGEIYLAARFLWKEKS